MGGVASDSGESDCSLMSSVSQMSTASVTARARKRTRTTAKSAQDAVEILPASDKDALERLAKENTELRSQVASLKEAVAGLKNQLNLLSQQGATQKSQVSGLPEPAGLAPDVEAQLRRSIAIEIGTMMERVLHALEGRLLPEKPVRPALASDARRLVASKPVQIEVTAKKAKKKKKKKTKINAVTPIVAAALPVMASTSAAMDVQPGTANSQDNTTWSLVVGRKAKKANTPQPVASSASTVQVKKSSKPSVKLPKVPASAAITVRVREGATVGLGEVLAEARRRINLSEFGITSDSCREKRAADGGIGMSDVCALVLWTEVPSAMSAVEPIKRVSVLRQPQSARYAQTRSPCKPPGPLGPRAHRVGTLGAYPVTSGKTVAQWSRAAVQLAQQGSWETQRLPREVP
ncbi:hypothetical protein SFRURICE_011055 [Spodoptera frugiperda]|nr:hypothetical protein SFRURICE_011055 [Spodoptera frugiperda]